MCNLIIKWRTTLSLVSLGLFLALLSAMKVDLTSNFAFERIAIGFSLLVVFCLIGGMVDDHHRNQQVNPIGCKGISFNNPYSYLMSACIFASVPILFLYFCGYIDNGMYLTLLRWTVAGICIGSTFVMINYPRFFSVFLRRRRKQFGRERKTGMIAIMLVTCISFDCFLGDYGLGSWSPQSYHLAYVGATIFINTSLTLLGLHLFIKTKKAA